MMFIEKSTRISEPGTSKSEKFRKLVGIVIMQKCIYTRNVVRIKAAVCREKHCILGEYIFLDSRQFSGPAAVYLRPAPFRFSRKNDFRASRC